MSATTHTHSQGGRRTVGHLELLGVLRRSSFLTDPLVILVGQLVNGGRLAGAETRRRIVQDFLPCRLRSHSLRRGRHGRCLLAGLDHSGELSVRKGVVGRGRGLGRLGGLEKLALELIHLLVARSSIRATGVVSRVLITRLIGLIGLLEERAAYECVCGLHQHEARR
jgi:hypothetical protein